MKRLASSYSLISDSFKNWRGMEESGGRRIKRSVLIDINSIRFCTPDLVERFARIHRIKDYVAQKQGELREHNERNQIDDSVLVNGRRMTNVGTFRAYLVNYLRAHPKVHQEMTFLVRQLAPGERGLPIEIYVFSSDQAWVNYEDIQADIFDHIFAVLPEFGLRPFQNPAGADIASAIERLRIDLAPRN
jgi:miniconductance mechanosensitive channel